MGYDPESWHDLFVAMAGAAAALAGLLFVAVSINLADILKFPVLPRRALETLLIMLSVVLVSIFVLVPGQGATVLGLEIMATGIAFLLAISIPRIKLARTSPKDRTVVVPIIFALLSFLPIMMAGITLVLGAGGGLYWLVPALLFSFMAAITTAWVLLVEILR